MTEPCSLKPCPFCGGEAVIDQVDFVDTNENDASVFSVNCSICGAGHAPDDTKEDAITTWNTRTPPRAQMEVERLREALEFYGKATKVTVEYWLYPDSRDIETFEDDGRRARKALQPAASEG